MKVAAFFMVGVIGVIGFAVYHRTPDSGHVYNMSVAEAQKKLATTKMVPSGKRPPFYMLDVKISKPNSSSVKWSASGSHAAYECTAKITPEGEAQVRVYESCDGGSPADGAAASTTLEMTQIGMREHVDSTLRDRAFNSAGVEAATVGAVMANLPKMQHDALQMDAEMRREMNENR